MANADFVIFAIIGVFFLGAALGYLLAFRISKQRAPMQNMEKEMASNENCLKVLQEEINNHLVNLSLHTQEVNESCKALQGYLASTAVKLASPEVSRQILKETKLGDQLDEGDLGMAYHKGLIGAPKDYAPKVPGGILSEEYGLADSIDTTSIVEKVPTQEEKKSADPTLQIT